MVGLIPSWLPPQGLEIGVPVMSGRTPAWAFLGCPGVSCLHVGVPVPSLAGVSVRSHSLVSVSLVGLRASGHPSGVCLGLRKRRQSTSLIS